VSDHASKERCLGCEGGSVSHTCGKSPNADRVGAQYESHTCDEATLSELPDSMGAWAVARSRTIGWAVYNRGNFVVHVSYCPWCGSGLYGVSK